MAKGKRKVDEAKGNEPFPQDKIDLIFWQWGSGVIDIMNARERLELICNPVNVQHIQGLFDIKLARIREVFNGRSPSFTLTVKEEPNNKFSLIKTLIS